MLARSSLVALAFLSAGCLKDLTQVEMASDSTSSAPTTDTTATEPTSTTDDTPVCGDGELDPGEQCDDGNAMDGDGCESDCTTTPGEKCGDGNQDPDEDCDDGNNIDGDGCEGNCRLPVTMECGDGELSPGEQCDDGNTMSGDGCESNCTNTPKCGDGTQGPGEQCDDGNTDDDDACLSSCVPASCGDGIVWSGMEMCDEAAMNGMYGHCNTECSGPGESCGDGTRNGPEECDDANQVDDDDCSNTCIAFRRVFVTADGFTGNLGGIVGADAKCTQAAIDGLLPGDVEWLAWLSDGTSAPEGRMDTDYQGYFKLINGDIVAHGWADLSDGMLSVPININENGAPAEDPLAAWSNVTPDGLPVANGAHCNKWTSAKMADQGHYGDVSASGVTWTNVGPFACSSQHHIYCVQNAPPP
ncbi:DUF4215 domain-containing protein [Nannocystis sp. SCPEA4]|uniref:DUF4215 domain-containing protein n=1 Tax=Nannocystis sp. SCPEA4 TaxID=2996787 RepID=UPI00226DAB44|nr:DUF4215 domain-containing protein [Nannocystis sp. SCPEA4]MCY1059884.1 DUF4215 domain-containing protein [Nannocystis sp. SCPEA4]